MTAALAPSPSPFSDSNIDLFQAEGGVQGLLLPDLPKPSYRTTAIVLIVYALALAGVVTYSAKPVETPPEEPLELVIEPAAPAPEAPPTAEEKPVEQPPEVPPVEEPPVEEPPQDLAPPPPPAVEPEPVAPVEPPKPIPPKPVKKVEKKPPPAKPAVKKPAAAAAGHATPPGSAGTGGAAPSNAVVSGYANLVHARIARVAGNNYPRAALASGASGRVPYHIVIGPSGELISKSITPSGNPALDAAASAALARAAPFPPSGMPRPVSLSGAIAYRLH